MNDEVEPDTVAPIWDSKGRLAMRRGPTKVQEPSNLIGAEFFHHAPFFKRFRALGGHRC